MAARKSRSFHVIIIGAGTTGLAIAQGLKKANISHALYERDPIYGRSREWGMTMHHRSSAIRDCLPDRLLRRLRETWCDPQLKLTGGWEDYVPHYDGKTGELLFKVPAANPVRVSRRKLRRLMSDGLDIQYGKRLSSIQILGNGVKASFSDGTEAVGSVLVSCEGVRSLVRDILLGDAAKATRVTSMPFYNFTQTYSAEQAIRLASSHPQYINSTHPDGHGLFWLSLQEKPDPTRPETWVFQLILSWFGEGDSGKENADSSNASRLAEFKRRASLWTEPWKTAGINISNDTVVPRDVLAFWEPIPWDNYGGRLTIAGDAAHPMMPYLGQGLNTGLVDSANYVAAIRNHIYNGQALSDTIQAYDNEMRERGLREVRMGNEQGKSVLDWNILVASEGVKHLMEMTREHEERKTRLKAKL